MILDYHEIPRVKALRLTMVLGLNLLLVLVYLCLIDHHEKAMMSDNVTMPLICWRDGI